MVVIAAVANRGRINARVGGMTVAEAKATAKAKAKAKEQA
jgi:hypothetical protein